MNTLPGWKRKEKTKKETYTIEHEGSLYLYEVSGLARIFYRKIGEMEKEALSTIPDWIRDQLNAECKDRIVEHKEEKTEEKTNERMEQTHEKILPQSNSKVDNIETSKKEVENVPRNGINSIIDVLEEKRIITFQDMENLKKLSLFDRLLLFQKTPKQLIRQRKGFLKPSSASKDKKLLTDDDYQMFQYVPCHVMQIEANLAFLFEWSAVIESEKYFDTEVAVRGYIQTKVNGEQIRRPCGGSCIKKGMMDWGDALEGAISEMKKRGLKSFGFNSDVYRQEGEV